jgi:arabinogalactan oligomer/maltooligosaccharide transport system substrate-binding protein
MNSKMKRVLALGMSVAMMATLCVAPSISASAAKKAKANVTLTLWGSQDDQAMLKTMTANFKKQFTDNNYTFKLGVCGESDAKTNVLKDLDTAADVYAFATDQTATLESAGALTPVTIDTSKITKANSASSISACTIGKQLYAYPSSANSFFLYYDKSKLTASDVTSLETILAKKTASGVKNFSMNFNGNGWYGASFFFTAGCTLFGNTGRDATRCTFNNKNGLLAANYMIKLVANTKFVDYGSTNSDSLIVQNFKDGKLASAVSGTWNATKVQAALGKNYAAAKLPTIKINGRAAQMRAFASFKAYGVNSHSKHLKAAMELAEFLTNQANQKLRFQTKGYTPTNKVLSADKKALASNPAVAAEAAETQYAILQPSIDQMNNFWTPMGALGTSITDKKTTSATAQSDLNKLVKGILAKI